MTSRPAVFLDRDGTICVERDYPREPDRVALLPGAAEALRLLRAKGFLLFVVSNQSGVARGIIRPEEFEAVHRRVLALLDAAGAPVDGFGYCLHGPGDGCACRKPKTGLIPEAIAGHPVDRQGSYSVGDKACDLELGDALGARGCLVLTGHGVSTQAEVGERYPVYPDLLAMAHSV